MKHEPYNKVYYYSEQLHVDELPLPVIDTLIREFADPHAALEHLVYDSLMGCYLIGWGGMVLGIESDGHCHS